MLGEWVVHKIVEDSRPKFETNFMKIVRVVFWPQKGLVANIFRNNFSCLHFYWKYTFYQSRFRGLDARTGYRHSDHFSGSVGPKMNTYFQRKLEIYIFCDHFYTTSVPYQSVPEKVDFGPRVNWAKDKLNGCRRQICPLDRSANTGPSADRRQCSNWALAEVHHFEEV